MFLTASVFTLLVPRLPKEFDGEMLGEHLLSPTSLRGIGRIDPVKRFVAKFLQLGCPTAFTNAVHDMTETTRGQVDRQGKVSRDDRRRASGVPCFGKSHRDLPRRILEPMTTLIAVADLCVFFATRAGSSHVASARASPHPVPPVQIGAQDDPRGLTFDHDPRIVFTPITQAPLRCPARTPVTRPAFDLDEGSRHR